MSLLFHPNSTYKSALDLFKPYELNNTMIERTHKFRSLLEATCNAETWLNEFGNQGNFVSAASTEFIYTYRVSNPHYGST